MSAPPFARPTDGSRHPREAPEANIDVWVASGGSDGAHLVPLSLAWVDARVVVALPTDSITARNTAADRHARLAVGATLDLVTIDAELDGAHPADDAPARVADGDAALADRDPQALPTTAT